MCLFVLASPSLTSGARTLSRVEKARQILGFDSFEAVSLFPTATQSVLEIGEMGALEGSWLPARAEIRSKLERSDAVVLAYEVSEPSSHARSHQRHQVDWLRHEIAAAGTPIGTIGGRPQHPSRWQRHTSGEYPGMHFGRALEYSLQSSTDWPEQLNLGRYFDRHSGELQ